MLDRTSRLFAAFLLAVLASFGSQAAQAAAPQHHAQAPGYYRMKVGDLEVTALRDGSAVFDLHWLTASKPAMDDRVFVTHLHSDHIGGLTTQDGKRVFSNAEVFVSKAESDFWLSPEIAAKAPKDAQQFFLSARGIAAPYLDAGKWHTFSDSETLLDGMKLVSLHGHTPGHTGYEFSSQGQTILFWGDTIHEQLVQLSHPDITVVFDIDHAAAAATRKSLLPRLAREGVMIAGPHMPFPGMGRLRKEANVYVWAPVIFTDQWAAR